MSKFTFSSMTIDSTTVENTEFVYGQGQFEESGFDAENDTADAVHRIDRITRRGRGRAVLYGNKTSLGAPATLPSLGVSIVMTSVDGETIPRTGSVTLAVYRDAQQNTEIQFVTDPIPPAAAS